MTTSRFLPRTLLLRFFSLLLPPRAWLFTYGPRHFTYIFILAVIITSFVVYRAFSLSPSWLLPLPMRKLGIMGDAEANLFLSLLHSSLLFYFFFSFTPFKLVLRFIVCSRFVEFFSSTPEDLFAVISGVFPDRSPGGGSERRGYIF